MDQQEASFASLSVIQRPGHGNALSALLLPSGAYEDWPPLYNAVKDVKDILDILVRQYQFEEDKIVTLFDEQDM